MRGQETRSRVAVPGKAAAFITRQGGGKHQQHRQVLDQRPMQAQSAVGCTKINPASMYSRGDAPQHHQELNALFARLERMPEQLHRDLMRMKDIMTLMAGGKQRLGDFLHAADHRDHLQSMVSHLRQQQQQIAKLEEEKAECMQMIEKLNAQHTVADTASYEDGAAIPPQLHEAAASLHNESQGFMNELVDLVKEEHKLVILVDHAAVLEDGTDQDQVLQEAKLMSRLALQATACRAFLRGFESPSFGIEGAPVSPFRPPVDRKKALLDVFTKCRDLDPAAILHQVDEFTRYVDAKIRAFETDFSQLLEASSCRLLLQYSGKAQRLGSSTATDDITLKNRIRSTLASTLRKPDSMLFQSLLRMAKSAWLLHKLALSFNPTAEIMWVAQGSVFDGMYMQKMNKARDEEKLQQRTSISPAEGAVLERVMFAVLPGFTVRSIVVKAKVYVRPISSRNHDGLSHSRDQDAYSSYQFILSPAIQNQSRDLYPPSEAMASVGKTPQSDDGMH